MSEPDRAGTDGGHPADGDEPRPDTTTAGPSGRAAGEREAMTEQGAGGGGPAETGDGPEPGDVYVPV